MTDMMRWQEFVALLEKARSEERAVRVRHIEDVARDLRAEFRREVMELREEVGELVAEVHKLIEREAEHRVNNYNSLQRLFSSRTDHLV